MKKLISLLLVSLLLCCCILPVSADILWEPYDNDYYMSKSYDTFTGIARIYYVPDGMTVNFYESPEGGGLIKTVGAGTRIYVGFSRDLQGEAWGVGYPLGDWENQLDRIEKVVEKYQKPFFFSELALRLRRYVLILPSHFRVNILTP